MYFLELMNFSKHSEAILNSKEDPWSIKLAFEVLGWRLNLMKEFKVE